jgi:hypothetical protein
MARKNIKLQRKQRLISYRRVFLIATEGAKTEPLYFDMFNGVKTTIHVKPLSSRKHDTSPEQVLERAKAYVKDEGIRDGDEVWLVIDKDHWSDEQIQSVYQGCGKNKFSLAVSNPMFEYWLLLHFEDGGGVSGVRDCRDRLKKYLPNYNKSSLDIRKLLPGVDDAVMRAKAKDTPLCKDWPRTNGSTVYRLIINIKAV